ncbi:hypothetical protein LO80_03455 [Candidatus Francisella endociliophora]|uniref:Uncharacterized protein n=1 Tax=Candidatus Francisella endociliophora TaxID=653937 RepID=A0A097ENH5_9GAMM|nr:hypothetical protein [Francisella sp. FSC1006]AIT09115.1 hypothetical protein LO80_03455 [Francisella sp. FSC1006]
MNVSEEIKNEILLEVYNILKDEFSNINKFKYITIDCSGEVCIWSEIPTTNKDSVWYRSNDITEWEYVRNCLRLTKLLLEISTDWEELCFELPNPKKEWESDVRDIHIEHLDSNTPVVRTVFIDGVNVYESLKKLQAQQEIYDIIAKCQHELEPDWDREEKYFLALDSRYNECYFYIDSYAGYLVIDSRLCMSLEVAHHISGNELITKELWLEAFS